ncbi:hypothetical protein Amir_7019 [Actinosynnema mirum DSM 43827]|uniref:ABC-2 type transport system permease protein n=1 Tax=Actinosynnema mirum (strain ATCC 29888 / DSM 43827 / JCM 3225 / NBRC 14064 / NCIMB 13271 / NRRL B-12336 / IMRU 3971 / 101) TaxID=446462 RepID=C6WSE1_ACTMD|nr:hypothetical protein Amir_7019 [Actinosynnema mirum DSM 43827]AXX34319.1 Putative ABC transport system membrane protein [Actinosynnema pretiosum subsp. pretiosum]
MTAVALLAVERIKLFSTRSPWWCAALALVMTSGIATLIAMEMPAEAPVQVSTTQFTYSFGMSVVMVMAALAVTTEYRFGTMRATFQAVPNRNAVMVAKVVVVALLAGVVGEVIAFTSWGASRLVAADASQLGLESSADWRHVAGVGLVYAAAAVLAVGVGALVRHTAGAVAVLLVYSMVGESLIALIPDLGPKIQKWLPFAMADNFVLGSPSGEVVGGMGPPAPEGALAPWPSLGYFAAVAVAVFLVSLVVVNRRDA